MTKPLIKLRLELVSHDITSAGNLQDVLRLLPAANYYNVIGENRVLSDGRIFPKPNSKTLVNFTFEYQEHEIADCNAPFLEFWKPYLENCQEIMKTYGYQFLLNYEITVYDLHYPAMVFKQDILDFISTLQIELSLYFYNDQTR